VSAEVVLALGSNLGDRAQTLRSALREIGALPNFEVVRVSALYESAALTARGISSKEPAYLNSVLLGHCSVSAQQLLKSLQAIEQQHGRKRGERWAARTLDIDIIKFGDLESDDKNLTLPHPEAGKRAFVVVPWFEIQPTATLPQVGPIGSLLARQTGEVRVYESA